MSECKAWPKDWPWYKQACWSTFADRCDTLVGPCSCGAWHGEGEFTYQDGILRRYGEQVRNSDLTYFKEKVPIILKEEPPTLFEKKLGEQLSDRQVSYVLKVIEDICIHCWDSDYPCSCWNDE